MEIHVLHVEILIKMKINNDEINVKMSHIEEIFYNEYKNILIPLTSKIALTTLLNYIIVSRKMYKNDVIYFLQKKHIEDMIKKIP